MLRIRKNDKVVVIAGKDKGKTGKVLKVLLDKNKVVVEKINLAKKAKRRTQQDQKGGFIDVEVPVHISNVMLVDKDGKRTRAGVKVLKDGTKMRTCKTTGDTL